MIFSEIKQMVTDILYGCGFFYSGHLYVDYDDKFKGVSDNNGDYFYIRIDEGGDNFSAERFAESCDLQTISVDLVFVAHFSKCMDIDTVMAKVMREISSANVEFSSITVDGSKVFEEETGEKPRKRMNMIKILFRFKSLVNLLDCYEASECGEVCCDDSNGFSITRTMLD